MDYCTVLVFFTATIPCSLQYFYLFLVLKLCWNEKNRVFYIIISSTICTHGLFLGTLLQEKRQKSKNIFFLFFPPASKFKIAHFFVVCSFNLGATDLPPGFFQVLCPRRQQWPPFKVSKAATTKTTSFFSFYRNEI